ncbi:histidyl-tRNA synthetase [Pyrolobus fumarii 1A]|uniref:Histidine--tRNA ligase n=1 Tax=Pyrolobus fumarii (strain DSM 11204 / 1A) TaxID=694429 RepID=G0EGD4_PYRF1|nr:histidine--tRNA ligase [Pyrolobus fumarii]AEM39159.1 histidyl-tRNA synthetase [Pyrolobus fumarii 1A]
MKPKINLDPLRGFRDILAPDSEELTALATTFKRLARRHGYREVIPPTLERFELFALKSGEEIRRSMYVFRDKAGREVAMRPEATASIARIYLRHLRAQPKPVRLYYVVNCFRYEEPQYARYREFYQAGVELIGEQSPTGDIEVAALLYRFYEKIGMNKHIEVLAGTTGVYRALFEKYRVPEEKQDHILHLMDKKEYDKARLELESVNNELAEIASKLWDIGDIDTEGRFREAHSLLESVEPRAAEALEHLRFFAESLANLGAKIRTDLSFARGLAYYTGIIFEVKVPGFPVSIAGGGRYDTLIELYGGEHMPATGFAIGLDRTLIAAKEVGIDLRLEPEPAPRVAIVYLERGVLPYAIRVQGMLVEWGMEASIYGEKKLGRLLPRLAEEGYRYAVILGKREAERGVAAVRDLSTRRQVEVSLEKLPLTLLGWA